MSNTNNSSNSNAPDNMPYKNYKSTSLQALINRNWGSWNDVGRLARITNFLYNELENGYGKRYGFEEVKKEVNKMLLER